MSQGYRIPSDYKNDVSKYTHGWRSPAFFTMHPGLAYVTHHRHLNAGDRVRGSISQLVQSQPMVGPLMQGFRLITIATFTPDSIIYGWMRNGIRYEPSEYMKFDKFFFNPFLNYDGDVVVRAVAEDAGSFTCVDPSSDVPVRSFRMFPGLASYNREGDMSSVDFYDIWKSDVFCGNSDLKNANLFSVVGRGGLWDCMGVAPGTVYPNLHDSSTGNSKLAHSFDFTVAPFVAYFLSSYYYLANMQEKYMYYSRGAYSLTWYPYNTGEPAEAIADSSLVNLGFHQALCGFDPSAFLRVLSRLANDSSDPMSLSIQYRLDERVNADGFKEFLPWLYMGAQAHGGLFSVPYRPDFFNNILKIGDAPNVKMPVIEDESEGTVVSIPDLRYYTKLQNAMDRIFVAGGRFGDQLRTLFGTNSNPYTNKPDFLGIWQATLNPTNTVAMAAGTAEGESSVPGQMTARIDAATNFGGRRIDYYAKEPGTVMFISFLVPMPAYAQGLHPDLAVTTFADEFNPEMKGLGFQSVPRWRYSMLPNSFVIGDSVYVGDAGDVDPNLLSVGDTVAWDWLKTDYARLHGEFATNGYFDYWTLKRNFTDVWASVGDDGSVSSVSVGEYYGTYVNPLAWQYIFVAQSLLDPNFFVGFNFDLKVTSSVPANYMPYLGR